MKKTFEVKRISKTAAEIFILFLFLLLFPEKAFAIGPAMDREGSVERPLTVDNGAGLSGGEIRFLKNEASGTQQLSGVVKSQDGKVVVIDGGTEEDAGHLLKTIKDYGGTVNAWILTHAHSDHVGGLYAILKDHGGEIDIHDIYYCFPEREWYLQVDPVRIGMLDLLSQQLAMFPQERQHKVLAAGDVIPLSEHLSIRVMNAPRKSYDHFAINSSSVMYDITLDGKHLVILGDMGEQMGNQLMREGVLSGVTCDYLQLSHHGQNGTGLEFYRNLAPKNCIWSCPEWLYEAKNGNPDGYQTWRTKEWMCSLGVQKNYCTAYGDVVIR